MIIGGAKKEPVKKCYFVSQFSNTYCIQFHHLDLCNPLLHHSERIWVWLDSLRNSSTRWFRSSVRRSRPNNRHRNRKAKFLECISHCHIETDLVHSHLSKENKNEKNIVTHSNLFGLTYLAVYSESHPTDRYNHIAHHKLYFCQYIPHWNRSLQWVHKSSKAKQSVFHLSKTSAKLEAAAVSS